ncbi:Ectopic P granules protein 5-like protein [Frankliniella fusca]|uniref:Ectopic P granules protein 5-like protein n=1 Tax=Frankliniella fusca TaxID=407009 RepID=A0AAE1HCG8_9NEOP|nr:Ectopic P granules protein 5-like protein [Frankliniella fusca]
MSSRRGWSDWPNKQNDWNISKRPKQPKLDIKINLSQSTSSSSTSNKSSVTSAATRGGGFRRTSSMPTSSMPTSSNLSPVKEAQDGFIDPVQEEFDAMEAKALAEVASAIEQEYAQSQMDKDNAESKPAPAPLTRLLPPSDFKNNGSSNFENLFSEEFATDYVEECMQLASQEMQASQAIPAAANSSFSQAYNVFSKGIDAHSSVLEAPSFKKPLAPISIPKQTSTCTGASSRFSNLPGTSKTGQTAMNSFPRANLASEQLRNVQPKITSVNPQAETEVRRLAKLNDEQASELKKLREELRTSYGEASILRAQLRQVIVDKDNQKSRTAKSTLATEMQYKEKLNEMEKLVESLNLKLQFQEAEANTAKERLKLLSSNSERLRLVEPISPGAAKQTSGPTLRTPSRQRHVSGFLNRSTFEEPCSPRRPAKRSRPNDDEERLNIDIAPPPEHVVTVPKPETRSVGEQTVFDPSETIGGQRSSPLTLSEILSDRLTGIQLATVEVCNIESLKNDHSCFDEEENIPTLSLLKTNQKSRRKLDPLDPLDSRRPTLMNCAKSLKFLMSWKDATVDCSLTKDAICQIAEECSGILHYNLILVQTVGHPSEKDLRDRDQDIVIRGSGIVPPRNMDLLDEKQWYKEEYGVEMRRSLGILSEIVFVSPFAASLVTGGLTPSDIVIKRHSFSKLPEYSCNQSIPEEDEGDRFFMMRLLCEICSTIVDQKLTIVFNGVLAGVLNLLKNCARHQVFEEKAQRYVLRVIHLVLIARPASRVLLLLVDLLTSVSSYPIIMSSLCTKCDDDDNIMEMNGLCTFTKSTCILQLLCIHFKAVTDNNRWLLINSVSEWLVAVVAQDTDSPSWILANPGSSQEPHVDCCVLITCTLIQLLSDAYEIFQQLQVQEDLSILSQLTTDSFTHEEEKHLRNTLLQIMRRSIILCLKLVQNHMFKFMGRVEGLYEVLVHGIEENQKHLKLSSGLEMYLEDLLRTEHAAWHSPSSGGQHILKNPKCNLFSDFSCDRLEL